MKHHHHNLSVVIPTLNCAGMIVEHIESIKPWLDLASEVIVIDSHSEDGTPQLVREHLRHPQLRMISHPRGLYQSWNHAISQTTGDWIYLSTVGDSIQRSQLEHMLAGGCSLGSDVVSSPPSFVCADGHLTTSPVWPIEQILKDYKISGPTQISPLAAFYYALDCIPNAIIGSSASNIYRGDHLRTRPFPTEYSVVGDTAWAIKHSLETNFCYTDRIGSTFRFHSKVYQPPNAIEISKICKSLIELATKTYLNSSISSGPFSLFDLHFDFTHTLDDARTRYRILRKSGILPWYFKPGAWQARAERNNLLKQRKGLTSIRSLILKEPVRVIGQAS